MSKEYKEIEIKLYNYYSKDKKILDLDEKIRTIKKQIIRIENEEIKIEDDGIASPGFSERVQTSSSGTGYTERELIRQIESKEKRINFLMNEITAAEIAKEKIKADNITIDKKIRLFSEDIKELLRLKYSEKCNEVKIGYKLNMDQSTVCKKKNLILKDLQESMLGI